jgi:hypothetical protein
VNIFSQEARTLADGMVQARDITREALEDLKLVAQHVKTGTPLPERLGAQWDIDLDSLPDDLEISNTMAPRLSSLRATDGVDHVKADDGLSQGM